MTDSALAEENARLKARLAETEAALADAVEAQKRLESIVSELRREKFGSKSEKLDPEPFNLPLEDIPACRPRGRRSGPSCRIFGALLLQTGTSPETSAADRAGYRTRNHALPPILGPCGCGKMARIGEDVSERLDVVPAKVRVLVTRRPK